MTIYEQADIRILPGATWQEPLSSKMANSAICTVGLRKIGGRAYGPAAISRIESPMSYLHFPFRFPLVLIGGAIAFVVFIAPLFEIQIVTPLARIKPVMPDL